jgi:hypothetical protein
LIPIGSIHKAVVNIQLDGFFEFFWRRVGLVQSSRYEPSSTENSENSMKVGEDRKNMAPVVLIFFTDIFYLKNVEF